MNEFDDAMPVTAPEQIICVDCGGTCHLITPPFDNSNDPTHPDPGFRAGDIVAYRCADCLDRWDVELG